MFPVPFTNKKSTMRTMVIFSVCLTVTLARITTDCDLNNCNNEKCRCSSTRPPISGKIPQLVSLTFNEAVGEFYYNKIWKPLLKGRRNYDGSIVKATFFVPHEYTNYSLVRELYNMGHEIGVHSVSKFSDQDYWRTSSVDKLTQEFGDQKKIINAFAQIPLSEIRGARVPQLVYNGDKTFQAYINAGLEYDNSWPSPPQDRFFPYTLDYPSKQRCEVTQKCPEQSFKGFWVNPIIDLTGRDGKYCHEIYGCDISGNAQDIAAWLLDQVMASYNGTRAPVTLMVDIPWFETNKHAMEGMTIFLDELSKIEDIYLVSQYEIVNWMKNPVLANDFKHTSKTHDLKCKKLMSCFYRIDGADNMRILPTCERCPICYPWLGNPLGKYVRDCGFE